MRRQREPGNNKYLSPEILLRRLEDITFKILNNLDQKFAEPWVLWLFRITLVRIKILWRNIQLHNVLDVIILSAARKSYSRKFLQGKKKRRLF
jgi:hypothetical protein